MMKPLKELNENEIQILGILKDHVYDADHLCDTLKSHKIINAKEFEQIEHSLKDIIEILNLNEITTQTDNLCNSVVRLKENA